MDESTDSQANIAEDPYINRQNIILEYPSPRDWSKSLLDKTRLQGLCKACARRMHCANALRWIDMIECSEYL